MLGNKPKTKILLDGGISKWTVQAWLAKGKLRSTKVGAGCVHGLVRQRLDKDFAVKLREG